MQNPVEGCLEVYEDMVEVLLVLVIFCDALACSEACLFFGDDLLRLRLQSVQYDRQYDCAWVADEADCSVVLALMEIAFLGKCYD